MINSLSHRQSRGRGRRRSGEYRESSATFGDDTFPVTLRRRLVPPSRTVADAADTFLARATAITTRRSYGQTMSALTAVYGDRPLEVLDGPAVVEFAADSSAALAPATWNRHVATLRSFTAFCRRQGWLQVDPCAGLERRPEKTDRTKAVADTSLERLFRREDVPGREKCLWRLLYETAARAQEVLSLNVEDVNLDNKRAAPPPRAVTPSGYIFSPAPPACCPASSPDARPAHCSSPIAAPHPPAHPPPSTSAPSPGGDGCPTNAPSTCSSGTPGGSAAPDSPCTSSDTRR